MRPGQPVPVLRIGPTYDWSDYDSLLARYAGTGRVDYASWKKAGTSELDRVLSRASGWADYDSAQAEEKLAFLVNAYNAFVIRDVLAHYPIATVKDVPGFFDGTRHSLLGASYTLDQIEKKLIKPLAPGDPAYHFALVCASRGCPPLRARAYRASTWSGDTANQAQHFLADPTKLRLDEEPYVLNVSELFNWYRGEFEQGDITLPRWIGPNLSLGIAMKMAASEPPVEFLPFDWSLNDTSAGAP